MNLSGPNRLWLVVAVALLVVAVPQAATVAQERVRVSPWEHELWRSSSPAMLNYICNFSRQPATWCPEVMRQQSVNPETAAELYGPQLTADDARWLRLVASVDLNSLNGSDAVFIRRRAEEMRDPQAMEALGYLYAQGVHFEKDYAKAYLWYGRAFMAGETQVKANMDILWKQINEADRSVAEQLVRIFREEARAQELTLDYDGAQGDPGANTESGTDTAAAANAGADQAPDANDGRGGE